MYRLATMHSVTDRQTDRQHYHANSRSAKKQNVSSGFVEKNNCCPTNQRQSCWIKV